MAKSRSSYSEYKFSDIALLGEVPSHWKRCKFKFIAKRGKDFASGPFGSSIGSKFYKDKGVPVIRGNNLSLRGAKPKFVDGGYVFLSEEKAHELSNAEVKPGDLVFTARGTVGQIGLVPVYDQLSWNTAILSANQLRFRNECTGVLSNFLWYLFSSTNLLTQILLSSDSVAQPNLNLGSLKDLHLLVPPKEEQQKIADFLDHETAKIDTLIEKQQKLIELLKEKRQAVISHAVTKGLNPDAPMKDSGVEWLGKVPAHWEVRQAKYIADITRGAILRPVDAPEYFQESGEWAYLNISDATQCDKYLYKSKLYLSPLGSTKSARVFPDNVIITASATIGKAFINKIKVCVHDGFIPFCNLKIDNSYLYHYLSNPFLYAAMGKSNTQKNIYLDEVKNMVVTVPTDEEQIHIVEYIESTALILENLILKAEQAIELMKERRTALISAAVTGKIDVRNWSKEAS